MSENDFFFSLVLFLVLAVAAGLVLQKRQDAGPMDNIELKLFLWAFCTRFATSIIIYEFGLVAVLGDEDSSGWFAGVLHSRDWERRGLGILDLPTMLASAWTGRQVGYQYLLGLLFHFTASEGRMPAAVLNCFFGALIVVFSYRIARSIFSEWVSTRVGWATCFFPSLIIWSAQTLKEPVVILLETIALYCCIQLKKKGFELRYAVCCGLAIVLMVPFRFYAAYISAAAVVVTLTLPQLRKLKLSWGSMVAIAALVVPIIWFSGVMAIHEAQFEAFNAQRVQAFRTAISSGEGGGSGVRSNYNLQNPIELVQAIAVGGAHVLLAPFPWQLGFRSMRLIGTTPELVVWWWLFFFGVIPGIWYGIRHRFGDIQPMLYFVLGLGMLYSLMFGNVGLAYRHRAQLLPFLLMLAVLGLEQRRLKRLASRRLPLSPQWRAELTDERHPRPVLNA